ncbi:MAG: ABC transporter ATP-binding protein [Thermoanaerobaculaceae bacterium]|nr:ABC transporter ATP-binding protein [Thermoanaerobaculaceae bacterium]MDI9621361.1 ABC transporter ATP-binding protein [Acidobacteriota bacterium]HPW56295.1 ABC transporter ATP-binding protein [Thermoanaerobaculaceae bacterium]
MKPLRVSLAEKRFGDTTALAGVSLELEAGELLALLGPNGAGKTTLVRAIAGRVRLDAGRIELGGRLAEERGARDVLGVVPQDIALYGMLTPRENLELFGRLHGLGGTALSDAVGWALGWTGLEDRSRELVKTFSGGMKRRLNIAAGVLHRPRIVLLDEPTVGVDPQSRERIYEMLTELRREGASLLLTTHQLDEAESRCDRVVIIDHGTVVGAGTLAELVGRLFGGRRTVVLTLDRAPEMPLPGLELEPGERTARAMLGDAVDELPALLGRVRAAGFEVEDLALHRPGLGAVFLALTGRELRE